MADTSFIGVILAIQIFRDVHTITDILLVIGTFLLAGITYKLCRDTISINKDTLRAYIVVDCTAHTLVNNKTQISWDILITNGGKTPAKNVRYVAKICKLPATILDSTIHAIMNSASAISIGNIGPNNTTKLETILSSANEIIIDSSDTHAQFQPNLPERIYIIVKVTYESFDKEYYTEVTKYILNGTANGEFVTPGNNFT